MTNDRAGKQSGPTASVSATASPPSERVAAIDALRGFDMFWIVGGRELILAAIALTPQPVPEWAEQAKQQFEHTDWQGFTAWDLIMPLFLFVVGAAMPFSFSRRLELGQSRKKLYVKILRRTVILFILGMMVQGHLLDFNLSKLHLFANTLQAIAVGYLIAGILLIIVPVWGQVVAAMILMVAYWLLLMYLPVSHHSVCLIAYPPLLMRVPIPGHFVGVLEPDANIAMTVDEFVLRRFRDGTPYTWVLSSMTFTATVLLGVFAGHALRSRFSPLMKFIWLSLLGVVCLAAGWAWAEYLHFPIIKHNWTSSMVLWAAGWSYLLLAAFYFVIDVVGLQFWAFPFIVIGMNAIAIYVAWHFIPFPKIAEGLVGGLSQHLGTAGPFAIAFTTVLLVWLLLYHLYRQKIFLRI